MTSDLKVLSEFVHIIRQWEQDGMPPDALLKQTVTMMSDISYLRLYRLAGHHIVQQFSSDDTLTENLPTDLQQPTQHNGAWLYPLLWRDARLGILEVGFVDEANQDLAAMLASQLAFVLDHYIINSMIENQAFIAARLANCKTFGEIAEALSLDVLREGQFISINLFEYDDLDNFVGFRVIATANRYKSYDADYVIPVQWHEIGRGLQRAIEYGEHHMIEDVQAYADISDRLKVTLSGDPIVSSYIFPIRSQGKVLGLINFNSVRHPISLTYTETLFWQALADQAGVLVLLHNLTQEAVFSQDISAKQTMVFNQLSAGQTWDDMTQIVARYMLPQSRRLLAVAELIFDETGEITRWVIHAVANREKLFDWNEDTELNWDDIGTELQVAIRNNDIFILKDIRNIKPDQVGRAFYEWLQTNEVRTYLSVPISAGDKPIGVMIFMSRDWNAFKRDEVNAFQNIGELMGALLEIGRLDQQTRRANSIVMNLVQANRLITTAADAAQMARAVMQTLAKQNRAVGITLLDTPLQSPEPTPNKLVAISTTEETILFDEPVDVTQVTPRNLQRLLDGQHVLLDTSRNDQLIPTVVRERMHVPASAWLALFGLRSGSELIGTLVLMNDAVYDLSLEEISAYTTLADQIGLSLKSRQLLVMTQQAQQVATRLLEANRAITLAEDFTEMVKVVLNLMPQGILTASIALFNRAVVEGDLPESIVTRVVATREQVFQPNIWDELPPDYPGFDMVISRLLQGGGLQVEDTRNRNNLIKHATDFLEEQGVYSFVTVGLRAGRRLLGLLSLGKLAETQVTAQQIANMQAIADQMAVTIENQRLVQRSQDAAHRLEKQVHQMEQIAAFSQALQSTFDLRTILEISLINATQIFTADYTAIMLYNTTRAALYAVAWQINSQDPVVDLTEGMPVEISGTTAGLVWETRQPLQTNDISQLDNRRFTFLDDIQSVLSLPIVSRGVVTGILELGSLKRGAYSITDYVVSQQFANQLAVAIENAEVYAQSQRLAKSKAKVNEISSLLQQQMDIEQILDLTLNELGQVLGAKRGRIRLNVDD
ncbi:MAG: GAF domain-containing protein [Chloroflexi bacterium]|nr:MAG: GAF domain-containing protein [Chloroflexota bacterium]